MGLIKAIGEAKKQGTGVEKSCQILELRRERYYAWIRGEDIEDQHPGPKIAPHRLLEEEKEAILECARNEEYADLHYRKLAIKASEEGKIQASPSTFYRVMKAVGLVAKSYVSKKRSDKPELEATRPNEVWQWDLTYIRVKEFFMYLIAIIDRYSRKIVGYHLSFTQTAEDVKKAWDNALEKEGLLEKENIKMPLAFSDHGSPMKAKSIRQFFKDLGIVQEFSRCQTPEDNALMEVWFKTLKYEKLYREETENPVQTRETVEGFIDFYNNERLHQGIGYVTPQQKHSGEDVKILAERQKRKEEARRKRLEINRQKSQKVRKDFAELVILVEDTKSGLWRFQPPPLGEEEGGLGVGVGVKNVLLN